MLESFMNKIFKRSCIITLVVIITEITLRFTGFVILQKSEKLNIPRNQKNIILTIGESTSADYFADKVNSSWPRILEKQLIENGFDVKVINKAVPGTNTIHILENIDSYLDSYKPDIVISMMGINDNLNSIYSRSFVDIYLMELKVVKIIKWVFSLFTSPRLQNKFDDLEISKNIVDENLSRIVGEKNELLLSFDDKKILSYYYYYKAMDLLTNKHSKNIKKKALVHLKKSYGLYPVNHQIVFYNLYCSKGIENDYFKKVVNEIFRKDFFITTSISHLLESYPWERGPAKNYVNLLNMRSSDNVNPTGFHYRMLLEKLESREIRLMAMQYPTLKLDKLKKYFKKEFQPIFISNENFNNILKKQPYERLFIDRFKSTWGHTSHFGHKVIADNVFIKLVENNLLKKP